MNRPALPDLPTFCKGPFRACAISARVYGVDEFGGSVPVADIRGWGYLTGKGTALALPSDDAFAAQRKTAEFIAAAMNAAMEGAQK